MVECPCEPVRESDDGLRVSGVYCSMRIEGIEESGYDEKETEVNSEDTGTSGSRRNPDTLIRANASNLSKINHFTVQSERGDVREETKQPKQGVVFPVVEITFYLGRVLIRV